MNTYFAQAALVGAVALVLVGVGVFRHWNLKYGWSMALCVMIGEQAGNWVLRLGFLAVVMLAAGGLQLVGVALPPEIERFIPSMWQALLVAITSAGTYWMAPTKREPEGGGDT